MDILEYNITTSLVLVDRDNKTICEMWFYVVSHILPSISTTIKPMIIKILSSSTIVRRKPEICTTQNY